MSNTERYIAAACRKFHGDTDVAIDLDAVKSVAPGTTTSTCDGPMTDLTLPTVHLNGTSRTMLSEGYLAAYHKLQEFKEAFRSIEFNARDYYVQGDTAFSKARTDRDIMEHKIGALMQYLEAHLIHLGQ